MVAAVAAVAVALVSVQVSATPWRTQAGGLVLYGGQQRQAYGIDLRMQNDGNLVLYDWLINAPYETAIWHTHTYGNPGAYATFQSDGNLVVYNSGGFALWDSQSWSNNQNSTMVLTDDGNLQIFSTTSAIRWTSGTSRLPASGSVPGAAPFNLTRANDSTHKWYNIESRAAYIADWEWRFAGPGGEAVYEPTDLNFYQSQNSPDVGWYVTTNLYSSGAYAETQCISLNSNGTCFRFFIRINEASLTQNLPSHMKNNLVCHELAHTLGFNDGGTAGGSCLTNGQNARLGWWERNQINAVY